MRLPISTVHSSSAPAPGNGGGGRNATAGSARRVPQGASSNLTPRRDPMADARLSIDVREADVGVLRFVQQEVAPNVDPVHPEGESRGVSPSAICQVRSRICRGLAGATQRCY